MNTSETPRTDGEEFFLPPEAANCIEPPQNDGVVESKYARTLERELAEAKAEVAGLRTALEIRNQVWDDEFGWIHKDAIVTLAALRAEVAELREDKARLDWLEDSGHHIHVSCWHASPAKENEWTIHDGDFDDEPIGAAKLLRAAIDAARKEGA